MTDIWHQHRPVQKADSRGPTGQRRKRLIRAQEPCHNRRSGLKEGRQSCEKTSPHLFHSETESISESIGFSAGPPSPPPLCLPLEVWVTCGEAWWGLLICLARACGFCVSLTTSPERVLGTGKISDQWRSRAESRPRTGLSWPEVHTVWARSQVIKTFLCVFK